LVSGNTNKSLRPNEGSTDRPTDQASEFALATKLLFCFLQNSRKKNSPDKHYFGSLHRMFVDLQPEPQKAWKNWNVPIYLFRASANIENCIGLRIKFLGLGLIISVRISSAEVFVLHWSSGGK